MAQVIYHENPHRPSEREALEFPEEHSVLIRDAWCSDEEWRDKVFSAIKKTCKHEAATKESSPIINEGIVLRIPLEIEPGQYVTPEVLKNALQKWCKDKKGITFRIEGNGATITGPKELLSRITLLITREEK